MKGAQNSQKKALKKQRLQKSALTLQYNMGPDGRHFNGVFCRRTSPMRVHSKKACFSPSALAIF
jgi:hypothetical protein